MTRGGQPQTLPGVRPSHLESRTVPLASGTMPHLLVVDDDFDLVECLSDVLQDAGYDVRTARTGEEGLEALRDAPLPDAILLDVDMPVLGGPGMAHKMMLHDAGQERIPIVLSSGRGDLAALAAKMGTPYCIAKPVALDKVLELIARALRERVAPSSA